METTSLAALRQYQIAKQAITGGAPTPPVSPDQSAVGAPATRFTDAIESAKDSSAIAQGIEEFSNVFARVETATEAMATGQADAHAVVEALATAEVALETAVTIRNRVVEAYQELLRMPV